MHTVTSLVQNKLSAHLLHSNANTITVKTSLKSRHDIESFDTGLCNCKFLVRNENFKSKLSVEDFVTRSQGRALVSFYIYCYGYFSFGKVRFGHLFITV